MRMKTDRSSSGGRLEALLVLMIALLGSQVGCSQAFQVAASKTTSSSNNAIGDILPEGSGDPGSGGTLSPGNTTVQACTPGADPGRTTAQRLNATEYKNSVKDLFGLASLPSLTLPEDGYSSSFNNDANVLFVNPEWVAAYMTAAETVVNAAFASNRSGVMTCATTDASCASQILGAIAERAYRRPLKTGELPALTGLVTAAQGRGETFEAGIKIALRAVLMSPQFNFRIIQMANADDATAVAELNDLDLASRLSYFLWSSIPDSTLLTVAKQGKLKDPVELKNQVTRMLASPKSSALVDNFAMQWLRVNLLGNAKLDATIYPGLDANMKSSMAEETRRLVASIFSADASPMELLSAKYTYMNETIAGLYGNTTVKGTAFQKVALGSDRQGILTQPSIMLVHSHEQESSIVLRGKWVLSELLCDMPPPPPANFPVVPDSTETSRSTQRLTTMPCMNCHQVMDRVGMVLYSFDPLGRKRQTDQSGTAIATSITLPDGRTFASAADLASSIVSDPRFKKCMARKMLGYAVGRELKSYNHCAAGNVGLDTIAADKGISNLVLGVVTSDMFRKQRGDGGKQ